MLDKNENKQKGTGDGPFKTSQPENASHMEGQNRLRKSPFKKHLCSAESFLSLLSERERSDLFTKFTTPIKKPFNISRREKSYRNFLDLTYWGHNGAKNVKFFVFFKLYYLSNYYFAPCLTFFAFAFHKTEVVNFCFSLSLGIFQQKVVPIII